MTKPKQSRVKTYKVVSEDDDNISFSFEAKNDKDALFQALEILKYRLVEVE
jgi:hypothetical protein